MSPWVVGAIGAAGAFALTFACRRVALATGVIAQPAEDRWSTAAVPLLGGVAIAFGTALAIAQIPGAPLQVWLLMAGALTMCLVGLIDDVWPIGPAAKFTAQLVAAAAVTAAGLRFPLTGVALVDIAITMFWLVGLTNAFNLLDNMDGLSAGIAAIGAAVKTLLFVLQGELLFAAVAAGFAGACVGFLAHNLVPKRVFMGDAGSLFLGFFLAGLSTIGAAPGSRATAAVLIIPVVILLVPIFDTVLVTAVRVMTGRPVSQGGRDHVSHRLVMAGLSERSAVLALYALATAAGLGAILTRDSSLAVGLLTLIGLAVLFSILGVALVRGSADRTVSPGAGVTLGSLPVPVLRQLATAGINSVLVLVSLYAAFAFRYGTEVALERPLLIASLPVMFGAKMLSLGLLRTYRSVWRYTDSRDLVALVTASSCGSALGLAMLVLLQSFDADDRLVFVLDWVLFSTLLAGSRLSLRALSEILRPTAAGAKRVLIYGAGDAGVTLLQELRRTVAWGRQVVGFLDDDPVKRKTRLQGLPVLGGVNELEAVLGAHGVEEVIVASTKLSPERRARAKVVCDTAGVPIRRFWVSMQGFGVDQDL